MKTMIDNAKIAKIEQSILNSDKKINAVSTKADEANVKANEASTKADEVSNRVDAVDAKAVAAGTKADAASTKATEASTKATEANTKIKATDARLTETNSRVDTANQNIQDIDVRLTATDARVSAIKSVPEATAEDAGKVLTVGSDGSVIWQVKGAGGGSMKAYFDAGGKCAFSGKTGGAMWSFDGIINESDTADVTDFSQMFYGVHRLSNLPSLDYTNGEDFQGFAMYGEPFYKMNWYNKDFPKATNFNNAFAQTMIESIDYFTAPNAMWMNQMFENCTNLTDISNVCNRSDLFQNVLSTNSMFNGCSSLVSVPDVIVLSDDPSISVNVSSMFSNCSSLESFPGFRNSERINKIQALFNGCTSLRTVATIDNPINVMNINNDPLSDLFALFSNCSSLEEIHMINIGSDLDISASTLFTHEALLEIINNLNSTSETRTLTMGETNLAKLNDSEKETAINKGWTLA